MTCGMVGGRGAREIRVHEIADQADIAVQVPVETERRASRPLRIGRHIGEAEAETIGINIQLGIPKGDFPRTPLTQRRRKWAARYDVAER